MKEMQIKTEKKIKELNRMPTVKEWNKIAKEENLLSTITIRAIYNMPFYSYCREVRKS